MLVAQSLDPTVFPQSPGLAANLAGMEGLLYGGFDALVNGVIRMVHMDIWMLRTTRGWFRRDLDVLRPFLEKMRTEGADFLQRNAALGEEIRRTLVDLDEVEKELKKVTRAIDAASGLTGKYRVRLQSLCESTAAQKIVPARQLNDSEFAQAGD
jgi:hypothetical protein